jgi:hypothetical protein
MLNEAAPEQAEAVWSYAAIPNKIIRQVEKEEFEYKKVFSLAAKIEST